MGLTSSHPLLGQIPSPYIGVCASGGRSSLFLDIQEGKVVFIHPNASSNQTTTCDLLVQSASNSSDPEAAAATTSAAAAAGASSAAFPAANFDKQVGTASLSFVDVAPPGRTPLSGLEHVIAEELQRAPGVAFAQSPAALAPVLRWLDASVGRLDRIRLSFVASKIQSESLAHPSALRILLQRSGVGLMYSPVSREEQSALLQAVAQKRKAAASQSRGPFAESAEAFLRIGNARHAWFRAIQIADRSQVGSLFHCRNELQSVWTHLLFVAQVHGNVASPEPLGSQQQQALAESALGLAIRIGSGSALIQAANILLATTGSIQGPRKDPSLQKLRVLTEACELDQQVHSLWQARMDSGVDDLQDAVSLSAIGQHIIRLMRLRAEKQPDWDKRAVDLSCELSELHARSVAKLLHTCITADDAIAGGWCSMTPSKHDLLVKADDLIADMHFCGGQDAFTASVFTTRMQAVKKLRVILTNIIIHPHVRKYRYIKMSAGVWKKLEDVPQALQLIDAVIGFKISMHCWQPDEDGWKAGETEVPKRILDDDSVAENLELLRLVATRLEFWNELYSRISNGKESHSQEDSKEDGTPRLDVNRDARNQLLDDALVLGNVFLQAVDAHGVAPQLFSGRAPPAFFNDQDVAIHKSPMDYICAYLGDTVLSLETTMRTMQKYGLKVEPRFERTMCRAQGAMWLAFGKASAHLQHRIVLLALSYPDGRVLPQTIVQTLQVRPSALRMACVDSSRPEEASNFWQVLRNLERSEDDLDIEETLQDPLVMAVLIASQNHIENLAGRGNGKNPAVFSSTNKLLEWAGQHHSKVKQLLQAYQKSFDSAVVTDAVLAYTAESADPNSQDANDLERKASEDGRSQPRSSPALTPRPSDIISAGIASADSQKGRSMRKSSMPQSSPSLRALVAQERRARLPPLYLGVGLEDMAEAAAAGDAAANDQSLSIDIEEKSSDFSLKRLESPAFGASSARLPSPALFSLSDPLDKKENHDAVNAATRHSPSVSVGDWSSDDQDASQRLIIRAAFQQEIVSALKLSESNDTNRLSLCVLFVCQRSLLSHAISPVMDRQQNAAVSLLLYFGHLLVGHAQSFWQHIQKQPNLSALDRASRWRMSFVSLLPEFASALTVLISTPHVHVPVGIPLLSAIQRLMHVAFEEDFEVSDNITANDDVQSDIAQLLQAGEHLISAWAPPRPCFADQHEFEVLMSTMPRLQKMRAIGRILDPSDAVRDFLGFQDDPLAHPPSVSGLTSVKDHADNDEVILKEAEQLLQRPASIASLPSTRTPARSTLATLIDTNVFHAPKLDAHLNRIPPSSRDEAVSAFRSMLQQTRFACPSSVLCHICGQSFASLTDLLVHEQTGRLYSNSSRESASKSQSLGGITDTDPLCLSSEAWFAAARFSMLWLCSRIAGRLVASPVPNHSQPVAVDRNSFAAHVHDYALPTSVEQWMASPLLQGGLEDDIVRRYLTASGIVLAPKSSSGPVFNSLSSISNANTATDDLTPSRMPQLSRVFSPTSAIPAEDSRWKLSDDEQQMLADIISQPDQSAAKALHERIMKVPQMRTYSMILKNIERRSNEISTALRFVVAAMIKHTGKAGLTLQIAHIIQAEPESVQIPKALVQIWVISHSKLSNYSRLRRDSEYSQCSEANCLEEAHLRASDSMYICDAGHRSETNSTAYRMDYENIAALITANAQFLLRVRSAAQLPHRPALLRQSSARARRIVFGFEQQTLGASGTSDDQAASPDESKSCPGKDAITQSSARDQLIAHRLRNTEGASEHVDIERLVVALAGGVSSRGWQLVPELESLMVDSVRRSVQRSTGMATLTWLARQAPLAFRTIAVGDFVSAFAQWNLMESSAVLPTSCHPLPPIPCTRSIDLDDAVNEAASDVQFGMYSGVSSSSIGAQPHPSRVRQRWDSSLHSAGVSFLATNHDSFSVFAGLNVSLLQRYASLSSSTSSMVASGSKQRPQMPGNNLEHRYAVILSLLDCWRVSWRRSDLGMLHGIGIVPVLSKLMSKFSSTCSSANPVVAGQLAIGQSARNILRLLVLSVLSQDPVQDSNADASSSFALDSDEDSDDDEEDGLPSLGEGAAAGLRVLMRACSSGDPSLRVVSRGENSSRAALVDQVLPSMDVCEILMLQTVLDRVLVSLKALYPSSLSVDDDFVFKNSPSGTAQAAKCMLAAQTAASQSITEPISVEQAESDVFELVSWLLTLSSCSGRIAQFLADCRIACPSSSAAASPSSNGNRLATSLLTSLVCCVVDQTLLSARCSRRIFRLVSILMPLVQDHHAHVIVAAASVLTGQSSYWSVENIYSHLLSMIGNHDIGCLIDQQKSVLKRTSQSLASIVSETCLLARRLFWSSALWRQCAREALSDAIRQSALSVSDLASDGDLNPQWRERLWGAIAVFGGFVDPLCVGATVRVKPDVSRFNSKAKAFAAHDRQEPEQDDPVPKQNRRRFVQNSFGGEHLYGDGAYLWGTIVAMQDAYLPLVAVRKRESPSGSPAQGLNSQFTAKSGSGASANGEYYVNDDLSAHELHSPIPVKSSQLVVVSSAPPIPLSMMPSGGGLVLISLLDVLLGDVSKEKDADDVFNTLIRARIARLLNNQLQQIFQMGDNHAKGSSSWDLLSNLLSSGVLPVLFAAADQTLSFGMLGNSDRIESKYRRVWSDLCDVSILSACSDSESKDQQPFAPSAKSFTAQANCEFGSQEEKLLREMGFPIEQVRLALMITNSDPNEAIALLSDWKEGEHWGPDGFDQFWQQHPIDLSRRIRSIGSQQKLLLNGAGDDTSKRILMLFPLMMTACDHDTNEGERAASQNSSGTRFLPGSVARVWGKAKHNTSSSASETHHVWQYLTDDNRWAPFSPRDCETLESARKDGSCVVRVDLDSPWPVIVRIDRMTSYTIANGLMRPVQRVPVPAPAQVADVYVISTSANAAVGDQQASADESKDDSIDSAALDREDVQNLAGASGYSAEWCARALRETSYDPNAAYFWIMQNTAELERWDQERKKKAEAHKARQAKRQREKELRERDGKAKLEAVLSARTQRRSEDTELRVRNRRSALQMVYAGDERKLDTELQLPASESLANDSLSTSFAQSTSFGAGMFPCVDDCTALSMRGKLVIISCIPESLAPDQRPIDHVLMKWTEGESNVSQTAWIHQDALESPFDQLQAEIPATGSEPTANDQASSMDDVNKMLQQVCEAEFIVNARKCVLHIIHMMSQTKASGLSCSPENLDGTDIHSILRISKLLMLDPQVARWKELTASSLEDSKDNAQNLSVDANVAVDESKAEICNPTAKSSARGFVSVWDMLRSVLVAPADSVLVALFGAEASIQLSLLLQTELQQHLLRASTHNLYSVSKSPYRRPLRLSNCLSIPGASHLLLTWDRRSHLESSNAVFRVFSGPPKGSSIPARLVEDDPGVELAAFSGSGASNWPDMVIASDSFHYTFETDANTGPNRFYKEAWTFGYHLRVVPLGWVQNNESDVVKQPMNNAWCIMEMFARDSRICESWMRLGNATSAQGLQIMPMTLSMVSYLKARSSPFKEFVARSATQLCLNLRKAAQSHELDEEKFIRVSFPDEHTEPLVKCLVQLIQFQAERRWGCSSVTSSLLDFVHVIRQRAFRRITESDEALWAPMGPEDVDNEFFRCIARAASLARIMLGHGENSQPSPRLMERAFEQVGQLRIIRWCFIIVLQCLQGAAFSESFRQEYITWIQEVSTMKNPPQAVELLIALKENLRSVVWTPPNWHSTPDGEKWVRSVRRAGSFSAVVVLLSELVDHIRNDRRRGGDNSAFTEEWVSTEAGWRKTVVGVISNSRVEVASIPEAASFPWTPAMDRALRVYTDRVLSVDCRFVDSMSFHDLPLPIPWHLLSLARFSALKDVPDSQLRARFALHRLFAYYMGNALPLLDFGDDSEWSFTSLLRSAGKKFLYFQVREVVWKRLHIKPVAPHKVQKPIQFVILNRAEADRPRKTVVSRFKHSLFYQLYRMIGQRVDPGELRRTDQAWMVRFVGEGGHDAGGLYNESLVLICQELQETGNGPNNSPVVSASSASVPFNTDVGGGGGGGGGGADGFDDDEVKHAPGVVHSAQKSNDSVHVSPSKTLAPLLSRPRLPFLQLCPNGVDDIGDNNFKFLPNTTITSPQMLSVYEFLGRLMGVSALDSNRSLPLDFPSLVWKSLVRESFTLNDLKKINHYEWMTIMMLMKPEELGSDAVEMTPDTFDATFPGLVFTARPFGAASSDQPKNSSPRANITAEAAPDAFAAAAAASATGTPNPMRGNLANLHPASKVSGIAGALGTAGSAQPPAIGTSDATPDPFTGLEGSSVDVELCPGGANRPVTFENRLEYARLLLKFRLSEYDVQLAAIARGISSVVRFEYLSMFTWWELETMVCGQEEIDVSLLHQQTKYDALTNDEQPHVRMFWRVLEGFSQDERRLFLRFALSRSRLPATAIAFGGKQFQIWVSSAQRRTLERCAKEGRPRESPYVRETMDRVLPVAHSCFWSLELPVYSSDAVMRERLLYACRNCVAIDADVNEQHHDSEAQGNLRMSNADSSW